MEGVQLTLTGIYTHDEILYYRLVVVNRSNLVYDVDALRFSIKDRKKLKRHAFQEIFLDPLWFRGDVTRIPPGARVVWWVALRKEVLPKDQYLDIGLLERHGARHLHLSVKYTSVLHAKIVNQL